MRLERTMKTASVAKLSITGKITQSFNRHQCQTSARHRPAVNWNRRKILGVFSQNNVRQKTRHQDRQSVTPLGDLLDYYADAIPETSLQTKPIEDTRFSDNSDDDSFRTDYSEL